MAAYANVTSLDDKRRPSLESCLKKLQGYADSTNIAEELDDDELVKLGYTVEREYKIDKRSREEWDASAEKAMDVALQVRKPKNYPFEGASNVKFPLVTVAALQFGARAYPAIIDGKRVVKGVPLGEDPDGQKLAKADRISQHMRWQLLYEMEEWEEDTDVLLHHLPIVGCAFRKIYRSGVLGRNKSEMVPAIHFVVNQKTQSLPTCPRITHEVPLYPHEIEERVLKGEFLDVDLPKPQDAEAEDDDAPHWFLEQHRLIDFDEDGYREPYIVTVHKETCKVVRIVANYQMDDIEHDAKRITRIAKGQYFVKYAFLPDPKGGFYNIGFGALLESISESIDTTLNQMLDAGHLQNAGGGFIGSGLRMKKGEIRLSPGKYVNVETAGTTIRDAVYNFEHPGPSPVLFQLLGTLVSAAKDITAVKDILTGDSGQQSPQTATTTLALIEQGLKVFTAIYKRVYRSLRDEYKLLFRLNARYMSDQEYFNFLDTQQAVAKQDYDEDSIDVVPVADPSMVTDMQKSSKAQILLQLMTTLPGVLKPQDTVAKMFEWIGVDGKDLIAEPQGPPPPTPEQQMQLAQTEADVKHKGAQTMREHATAARTLTEAQMMPHNQVMESVQKLAAMDQADQQLAQQQQQAQQKLQQDQEAAQQAQQTPNAQP